MALQRLFEAAHFEVDLAKAAEGSQDARLVIDLSEDPAAVFEIFDGLVVIAKLELYGADVVQGPGLAALFPQLLGQLETFQGVMQCLVEAAQPPERNGLDIECRRQSDFIVEVAQPRQRFVDDFQSLFQIGGDQVVVGQVARATGLSPFVAQLLRQQPRLFREFEGTRRMRGRDLSGFGDQAIHLRGCIGGPGGLRLVGRCHASWIVEESIL